MRSEPLISCVMPTHDRRRFVPMAVDYFLRQDWADRELIVVDDGTDPVGDLMPADPRIRYFRVSSRMTVGAKLNFACEQARGEWIARWDDDDWYAPNRLTRQAMTMAAGGAEICGHRRLLYCDIRDSCAFLYEYPAGERPWVLGSTSFFLRSYWRGRRFDEIDVGEDALFVWSAPPERVRVIDDSTLAVHFIHGGNVSAKDTSNAWWRPLPLSEIQALIGDDWRRYERVAASPRERELRPARNVYACLVHEKPECVIDLVRNLRHHDGDSPIVLYDGSDGGLFGTFPFERLGAVVHPSPRPMRWGALHEFALDSMKLALDAFPFDTITFVDSDQLATRGGYCRRIARALAGRPHAGIFGSAPGVQPRSTSVAPAAHALKELDLWRPFLRRFAGGEEKFVHWTFWPGTVITADAARDLVRLMKDEQLREIMRRSAIWATEEVVLPTLVTLCGYEYAANPSSCDYLRYRVSWLDGDVATALRREDVSWMHPVPRNYSDPIRTRIRGAAAHYAPVRAAATSPPGIGARPAIDSSLALERMHAIDGWLEVDEAELLVAAAARALLAFEPPHHIVEVGSYLGRGTVVLATVARLLACETAIVHAIDPHDGILGTRDAPVIVEPSFDAFERNIEAAGLRDVVRTIRRRANEVAPPAPVSLLVIDGLHDYPSVAADFFAFEAALRPDALVAFHDYAPYYDGVRALVDELTDSGRYTLLAQAGTMVVLGRK
jgi:glycosyltransferase involved in cell wall biosynthesis